MSKTRVGIIGCGNISTFHMNGYKAMPETCEVVAVCDIDEAKVKAYANRYGVKSYYTDYNEMIEKEKLDAVSVCTWNSEHKNASIAAMRGGANVICEKPMAMNTQEALEMKKVSEEEGKLLMIAFVRRFEDNADVMKNFIDSGSIGDIYYAKAVYLRRNGWPGGWFGDKAYAGGGPLIDLGVHVIDYVRYLSGSPKPVSAYGVTYDNLGPNRATGGQSWQASSTGHEFKYDVEDFASALVRFDNGLTLAVEASFNLNIKNDVGGVELFGTKSGVKIASGLEFFTDMNGMMVNVQPYGAVNTGFDAQFNREVSHFVDCIRNGTKCRATADDGVVVMKILDAIYESARTGKIAEIS